MLSRSKSVSALWNFSNCTSLMFSKVWNVQTPCTRSHMGRQQTANVLVYFFINFHDSLMAHHEGHSKSPQTDTVEQKIFRSHFATFQHSPLQLKCTSISLKLKFYCRKKFQFWSSSQQFALQITGAFDKFVVWHRWTLQMSMTLCYSLAPSSTTINCTTSYRAIIGHHKRRHICWQQGHCLRGKLLAERPSYSTTKSED